MATKPNTVFSTLSIGGGIHKNNLCIIVCYKKTADGKLFSAKKEPGSTVKCIDVLGVFKLTLPSPRIEISLRFNPCEALLSIE